jgi:hypothetical protein
LKAGGTTGDLEWWQAHRSQPGADAEVLRDVLARLRAWKGEHDRERALQLGPFLRLAWDAVFGDEDEQVAEAIGQLEDALAFR